MSYLHNYYCNYHSGPVPALILEFGFFWLILNMRLAYFGPEDLATLFCVAFVWPGHNSTVRF